jgi:hypothetical protein
VINVTVVQGDFKNLLREEQLEGEMPMQFAENLPGTPRPGTVLPPPSETHSSRPASPVGNQQAATEDQHWLRFSSRLYLKLFMSLLHDSFPDKPTEAAYQAENWGASKTSALVAAFYLLFTWMAFVAAIASSASVSLYSKVAYYGVCSGAAVPVVFLVAANIPHLYPLTWQIYLFYATWALPASVVFDAYECQFFQSTGNICATKDFVGYFTYLLAFPTVALFLLKARRWSVAFGGLAMTLSMIITVTPYNGRFARSIVNYIVFLIGGPLSPPKE